MGKDDIGLGIGENLRLQDGDWKMVGIFGGGNGEREGEVVADVMTVMAAYEIKRIDSDYFDEA